MRSVSIKIQGRGYIFFGHFGEFYDVKSMDRRQPVHIYLKPQYTENIFEARDALTHIWDIAQLLSSNSDF